MAIFAEKVLITEQLAHHVYRHQRDRLIWLDGNSQTTDRGWMLARLERLAAEERRRRRRQRVA
jgi:hypothetical protein